MSARPAPASARARSTASRHSPAMETSLRRDRCRVWPTPSTAARCFTVPPSSGLHDTHKVLLQGGAAGGVTERAVGPARNDLPRRRPDPGQAGGEHRVAAERAAGGGHIGGIAQAQGLTQKNLLVAERL